MFKRVSDPRPMTPQEIENAADADPDAQPLTQEDLLRPLSNTDWHAA